MRLLSSFALIIMDIKYMSQHPDYVGGLLLLLEAKVKGEKKVFLSAPDIIYLMNKMYS